MNRIAADAIHLGFSGTRDGMIKSQRRFFEALIKKFVAKNTFSEKFFHHGDCIGADAEAHDIVREYGFEIIIHPPLSDKFRAFKEGDVILPRKDYILRNHDIVNAAHLVVIVPSTNAEMLRSGTWATKRYAESQQKLWKVLKPAPDVSNLLL